MSASSTQISVGLALALLGMVSPPRRRTVEQLRRLAAARGIRSFHRDGRCLAIKYASRRELIALLDVKE